MLMKQTMKDSMKNYTESDQIAWDNLQKRVSKKKKILEDECNEDYYDGAM